MHIGRRLPPGSLLIARYPASELAPVPNEVFMYLELEGEGICHYNEHFFAEYKKCHLPLVNCNYEIKEAGDSFEVKVTSDRPAFFLTLDAQGIPGEFDDNCFTLLPEKPRRLVFAPKGDVTLSELQETLKIRHLRSTYR